MARRMAFGEISTPRRRRLVSLRARERSCLKRRGMQPVPVQRSRTRSSGGRFGAFWKKLTRCATEAAVSVLCGVSYEMRHELSCNSYLGISTPGLQRISKSPKYSLPSKYCSGFPDALSLTSRCRRGRLAIVFPLARRALATCSTCSRSHRSSLRAASRSRHGARRAGRKESIAYALRRSRVGMRGMSIKKFGSSFQSQCRYASASVISSCI